MSKTSKSLTSVTFIYIYIYICLVYIEDLNDIKVLQNILNVSTWENVSPQEVTAPFHINVL